jgi:hypothetical protein
MITEGELRRVDVGHLGPGNGRELPRSANSFSAFIEGNAQDFDGYAAVSRTYRQAQVQWRENFLRLSSGIAEGLRRSGKTTKHINQAIRQLEYNIFEGSNHQVNGGADVVRSASNRATPGDRSVLHTTIGNVDDFANRYGEEVNPLRRELTDRSAVLEERFTSHLTSGYQALVDAHDFFRDLKDGPEKETVSAFFRDHAEADRQERKKAKPGKYSPVREHWQGRAEEFNPTIFERFWSQYEKSAGASSAFEWARFGVMMAMAQRNEGVISEPSVMDVRRAVGRVPYEMWPKMLKEAYAAFYKTDAANLVAALRDRIAELFPHAIDRGVILPDVGEYLQERRKRLPEESVVTAEETILARDISQGEIGAEHEARTYGLGVVKHSGENGHPLVIQIVEPERLDEAIEELASSARTPQMKEDFKELIRAILKDPERPGAKNLVGRFFRSNGSKIPWKRFDPRAFKDIRLRDPESSRYRIIYIVSDSAVRPLVGIREIMHHNELDHLGRHDRRVFA